jgi:acylphosphatase
VTGTDVIARRIIVRGKVQGVFYRNWAVRTAKSLRLTGWVRNLSNGDVEILAVGPQEDVEGFERECWKGPFGSDVTQISSEKAPVEPLRTFERRPTV